MPLVIKASICCPTKIMPWKNLPKAFATDFCVHLAIQINQNRWGPFVDVLSTTELYNSSEQTRVSPEKLQLKVVSLIILIGNLDPPRLGGGTRLHFKPLLNKRY